MTDIRKQLPDCPLEYEVPDIPGTHTALVLPIHAADIDWQAKMLPWTLASLINNTDLILKGVHLYVACPDSDTKERITLALTKFDLPERTLSTGKYLFSKIRTGYSSYCIMDINYWAFRGQHRDQTADIKLPLGHLLRYNWGWGLADYSLHPLNNIMLKNTWVRSEFRSLHLTDPDSAAGQAQLAEHLMEAGTRARWLDAANTAVYGENYAKKLKNVAAYFFNESEPNWHLDASLLQYPSDDLSAFNAWYQKWHKPLGTEPCIGLWLLKTKRHAYNFKDSLMIEDSADWHHQDPSLPQYPRLCNMKGATQDGFIYAMHQLMGAQLGMKV